MTKLILASTSPRRRELLGKTGLKFTVEAPDYEEDMTLALPPAELVKHLSRRKAEAVANNHVHDPSVVIGSDSIVVFAGRVFGKPGTPEQAREFLRLLSGNCNSVITGYTIIDTGSGRSVTDAVASKVYFRSLTPAEIYQYVATGEPLDKAGAYAIQGLGAAFIDRIEGDRDGVIGLPLKAVVDSLRGFGISASEPAR